MSDLQYLLDQDVQEILTPAQREAVALVIKHGSGRKAANAAGKDQSVLNRTIRRAKAAAATKKGFQPSADLLHKTAAGMNVTGISTSYKPDGSVNQQWVKQAPEKENDQEKKLREFVDGLLEEVSGKYKPLPHKKKNIKDRLNVYCIGDHHLGMYSYKPETGSNYDVNIAENLLEQSFESLIARSEDAEAGLFLNMGDFLHTDSESGNTTAGTPQDTDGRYGRTVRHAAQLMQNMIARLLKKHKQVFVINVRGNHDKNASFFLNEIMRAYFSKEPRITVICNQAKFIPFVWGKTFILTHHGDGINAQKMHEVASRDFREQWGACPFTYGYVAHFHHKTVVEIGGITIEQWGVLCATDAYHASKGYGASRTMTCVTHDKMFGEVSRVTFNAAMADLSEH